MAGAYDATLKQLLDLCSPDWVAWLAPLVGLPSSVGAEPLDVDLSTVQPVADKVFQLQPPATGLLHLEVQTSPDSTFPWRLLLYNVLLEYRYSRPVHTLALLLRREALTSELTGSVVRHDASGREYHRFSYTIVRVWELPADDLLNGGLGATPLALVTDDAATRLPQVVDRFADRVTREAPSDADASLLLSCGFILMGLRYDKVVAQTLFHGVQKMRESSTYQAILEEGLEKGLEKGLEQGRDEGVIQARREDILALLQKRFGTVPPAVEAKVRAATDVAKLQAALIQVLDITAPGELTL